MTEEAFHQALAERPFDGSLRFVFADWLQEQGDLRGAELMLALKPSRSSAEERELAALRQRCRPRWLGPLADIAVADRCRFDRGALSLLTLAPDVSAADFVQRAADPRLSSVRAMRVTAGRSAAALDAWQARLPQLQFLGADVETLERVRGLSLDTLELYLRDAPAASPELTEDIVAPVASELERAAKLVRGLRQLTITSDDFVGPELSGALSWAVAHGPFHRCETFGLLVRHGTLEGAAQWLLSGADQPVGQWEVQLNEVRVRLRSGLLQVDVSEEGDGAGVELSARLATAAALIAQLKPLQPTLLEVIRPSAVTLNHQQLDALKAAQRRLPTVESLVVTSADRLDSSTPVAYETGRTSYGAAPDTVFE